MINTKYLPLFITIFLLIFVGIFIFKKTTNTIKTNKSFKDSIVYVHDTIYVDKNKKIVEPLKPIPSITKFKISEWVCAWGKWSGVVNDIQWSTTGKDILIYEVQHYNEDDEWVELWYFDTELEAGKCN